MQLGIFAKTFKRESLDSVLDAVESHELNIVQFNMACLNMETMPEEIPDHIAYRVRRSLSKHNLAMCALSATFNTVHPDSKKRENGIRRFRVLAGKAREMGAGLLTLCTGTRSTESMWKYHPDNHSNEAYRDLLETLSKLLDTAEEFNLRLGIEPEIHNVIDTPQKALELIKRMGTHRLCIIMDPSNIFQYDDLARMDDILKKAFDILGPYIGLAHAKDIIKEKHLRYGAAGSGILNYELYIKLLHDTGYKGPLILHSLSESEVSTSVKYLKQFLD